MSRKVLPLRSQCLELLLVGEFDDDGDGGDYGVRIDHFV